MKHILPTFQNFKEVLMSDVRSVVRLKTIILCTSATVLLSAPSALAAPDTWNTVAGGDWNTASNWTGTVPLAADTAIFNKALTGNVTLSGPAVLTNLNFDTLAAGPSNNLTIGTTGGNSITVSTGGAIQVLSTVTTTGQTFTLNAPVVLGSGSSAVAVAFTNAKTDATDTLVIGGQVSSGTSGTATLTLNGANTGYNTVSGNIVNGSGTVALTQSAGTWVLNGTNSYTGATSVTGGILDLQVTAAMSSGSTITVGSAGILGLGVGPSGFTSANIDSLFANTFTGVSMNGSAGVAIDTTNAVGGTFTYATNQTNNRSLTKIGVGTLILTGASTYSGTTTVANGTLETSGTNSSAGATTVGSAGTTAVLMLNNASNGGLAAGTLSFSSASGATESVNVNVGTSLSNAVTFSHNVGLTGLSGNSLTLNGVFTVGGSVVLSNGLTGGGVVNLSGGVSIAGGNNFQLSGGTTNISSVISETVAGGRFTLLSSGPTVTLSGNNTFSGGATIGSGTLNINSQGTSTTNSALGTGTFTITAGNIDATAGAVDLSGTTNNALSLNGNFTFVGTNNLNLGTGAATLGVATGTARTITTTANTLTIGGAIANGTTAVGIAKSGAGTLALGGASTYTGTTTINAGTLSINSIATVGSASSALGAPTTVPNGTIAFGNGTNAVALVYTGSGSTTDRVINLAGTTGGATITQSGTGNLDFQSAFTATGAGIKSLTLSGSTAGTGEIDGAIVDNSTTNKTSLSKNGTGTWYLTGASTYSGGTTVTAGKLYENNSTGSGTGTAAVTVNNTATLAGSGIIKPTTGTSGVTVNSGGILSSGGVQTSTSSASTVDGTHLTLDNTTLVNKVLTVNGGGNLTFALGYDSTGGTGALNFASPNLNSTSLNILGNTSGEISFTAAGSDSITLVDLTANGSGNRLALIYNNPYLLISATSDADYLGLVTTGGANANGYVLGVDNGSGGYTPFTIGVTDINGNPISSYSGLSLYLNNGELEVVPEPSSWALMLAGLAVLVIWQRRKNAGV